MIAWEPTLRFTSDYVREHMVFVVESGTRLVGVVAIEATPEPEIAHLWVHPDRHGQGIGRLLVDRATTHARSNGWASLRIEADPNAQAFYERLGAHQIGEIKAPVVGEDRSLPVLQLPVGGS